MDPRIVSDGRLAVEANEKMLELRSLGPAFGAGGRIVHSIMGAGEILDVDRGSGAYVVKFDALPTPRKISMKATLERE